MTSRLAAPLAASPHRDLRGDFGRSRRRVGWLSLWALTLYRREWTQNLTVLLGNKWT
jgi:hypothetical protein